MKWIFAVAALLLAASLGAQTKPGGVDSILPKEQVIVETCPAGIWFDNRCRGQRFWRKIKPDGQAFANAFGSAIKAPGQIGSAILITVENDAIIRQYHLNGEKRAVASAKEGGQTGILSTTNLPRGAGHLFDYELLSRVTVTKGESEGYNTIYYEVATPKTNGDLTLYYSVFRIYGPSGSYDEIECTTDAYLSDKGLTGSGDCIATSALAADGQSRTGCTKGEEVSAIVAGGIAAAGCNLGLGIIVASVAIESSASVFATVSVESANPLLGGAAAGATFVAVEGGGEIAKGKICPVARAVMEDLTGHATGCITSGLPATADEVIDIYDGPDLLDQAAGAWLASEGTCMRCNATTVRTVGGVWDKKTGEQTVEGELVCTDWNWVQGEDSNDDFFCD
jgi:hypothetical protein